MNSVDNNSDQVAMLIKDAATTFQPSAELKDSVRKRIMGIDIANDENTQSKSFPHRRKLSFRSWRMASAASVAIMATGAIVGLLVWPTSLTMAQVQEAVEAVPWVHVQYDNGDEQWISPSKRIWAASKAHGFAVFTDYRTGVQHKYYGRHSSQINERHLKPWDSSRSAWDVIVGYLEERVDEPGGNGRFQAERHLVVILDGRKLVRFDSYIIDALDQRTLVEQIWADPATRLPVKVRRRLQPGERQNPDQVFAVGLYTFPDSGPESIYDLGVPKELIVVKPDAREPEKEVAQLLESIGTAKNGFLENYRVIVWQNARTVEIDSGIDVLHFSGRPQLKESANKTQWMDFRGVRIRQERFINSTSDYPGYHLPLPATAEQVLAWSSTQTPVDLSLSDGESSYSQHGPMPPHYLALDKVSVRVDRVASTPLYSKENWPTDYQWPDPSRLRWTSIELLEAKASDPAGTIWLRSTSGSDRYDYFIDPTHDYICVKQIEWRRINDQWFKLQTVTLSNLVQLQSGHFVATSRRISWPSFFQSQSITWLIDIEELDLERIPSDTFDGEKLLENAKKIGATIETY